MKLRLLFEKDLKTEKGWRFFVPHERSYEAPVNYDLAYKYYASRLLRNFDRWETKQKAYEEARGAISDGMVFIDIDLDDWPELTGKEVTAFHTDDEFSSVTGETVSLIVKPTSITISNLSNLDLTPMRDRIPLDVVAHARQLLEQCKQTMTKALDAYAVDSGWLSSPTLK